jgi:hypothetical protein
MIRIHPVRVVKLSYLGQTVCVTPGTIYDRDRRHGSRTSEVGLPGVPVVLLGSNMLSIPEHGFDVGWSKDQQRNRLAQVSDNIEDITLADGIANQVAAMSRKFSTDFGRTYMPSTYGPTTITFSPSLCR